MLAAQGQSAGVNEGFSPQNSDQIEHSQRNRFLRSSTIVVRFMLKTPYKAWAYGAGIKELWSLFSGPQYLLWSLFNGKPSNLTLFSTD
jgi:hypothetical protein